MSKVETMLYGIYPRDEQLRIAISKWERGATTTSELSGIINKEKYNLLSVFRQSGLDHYTDPLVNWHDIWIGILFAKVVIDRVIVYFRLLVESVGLPVPSKLFELLAAYCVRYHP